MNIHETPELLTIELCKQKGVIAVSYEYPAFWHVDTEHGLIVLGDVNDEIGWNGMHTTTLDGWTKETEPVKIANAFGKWLEDLGEPSGLEIIMDACYQKGFDNAEIADLGGGCAGVEFPLSSKYWALITAEHGIGIYNAETYKDSEYTMEPVAGYWWTFDFDTMDTVNGFRNDLELALNWLATY